MITGLPTYFDSDLTFLIPSPSLVTGAKFFQVNIYTKLFFKLEHKHNCQQSGEDYKSLIETHETYENW